MNRSSHTLLVTGAMVCLVLLLPACAGQPIDTGPIQEPAEAEMGSTADPVAIEVTATHSTAADASAARQDGVETPAPTPKTRWESVATTPPVSWMQDPGLRRLVSLAKENLARQLSIPIDEIELLEVQEAMWPDASLGCPEPGMMYAQVLTEGYLVVLAAGEATYEYHTDRDQALTLCEGVPQPGQPSKDVDATVKDGWPSQPRGDDVIIVPPGGRKRP